jgi:hypothetical protein
MGRHAFVTWVETSTPWELENYLLSSGLNPPLNLEGNPCQEAVACLSAVRSKARQLADQLEIIADSGISPKIACLTRPLDEICYRDFGLGVGTFSISDLRRSKNALAITLTMGPCEPARFAAT